MPWIGTDIASTSVHAGAGTMSAPTPGEAIGMAIDYFFLTSFVRPGSVVPDGPDSRPAFA